MRILPAIASGVKTWATRWRARAAYVTLAAADTRTAQNMNPDDIERAAVFIAEHWRDDRHFDTLPEGTAPATLDDGYAIQSRFATLAKAPPCGFKLAATNVAGQQHINVSHPLIGRLFADRVYPTPAKLLMRANGMRVAEAEFCFRLGRALPPGKEPLDREQAMAAVDALFPAIEVPDSRFVDFAAAGAPALAADNACGREFVLGEEVTGQWREIAFGRFPVVVFLNGSLTCTGTGNDVLGDPRDALTWFLNECRRRGMALKSGEIVTTGVVGRPVPVNPGDYVRADFGVLGDVELAFAVEPED
jgi:2-keto-4-pentenoate hydratase